MGYARFLAKADKSIRYVLKIGYYGFFVGGNWKGCQVFFFAYGTWTLLLIVLYVFDAFGNKIDGNPYLK